MPTNLNPRSQTSAVVLPSTGSVTEVAAAVPFGVYTGSLGFITGASLQVNYTYKKLGGDVVDIELTTANVYAAYEEAVLEYSYIINLHQSKNALSSMLGEQTGTFNYNGEITSGPTNVNLKFPRFQIGYTKRVGDSMAAIGGFGGTVQEYSASFRPSENKQDYNLQSIISSSSVTGEDDGGNAVSFTGKVEDKRVIITKVFYQSPRAMWRFYGYYGGVGVVGNYSTYGQFADDSTFEIIPTWQNKLQAIMYEDSIYTRTSHYSYEIINNNLRLYPNPSYWDFGELDRIWVRFYVENNSWDEDPNYRSGVNGINNANTLPFDNLPFANINAIGKQWIRKYALALSKEMLGQIRGKFTTLPIPGESVTLNHSELLAQAKEEQTSLRDKLTEILKEMEYSVLAKTDQEITDASANTFKGSPLPIFVG
ncbi:hypothetical protein CMI47_06395 [Candidatus Pacearchaeota archaeon]|nr:hypothetical protein [Candidatus Pacearchaeota archaeon]|tara:strand:+ start:922 stop:2193 length:1272 start_codon:yes stop_codon:yes gene_type:complete